jgi:hypothetical protein
MYVEKNGISRRFALPAVPLPSTVVIEIGTVTMVVDSYSYFYDCSSASMYNQSFEVLNFRL